MAQKTYTGKSPILVPENEKIVSIAFPSEASSIMSLDIPETATIDVTACSDDFVHSVLQDTTKPNKKVTANNKIYYTALSKVTPNSTSALPIITSLEFSDGRGTITFATDVTSIGQSAFYNRSGLTSITIPNSVTSIGSNAFGWCSGLTSITIPDSVTSIGEGAFSNCSGLTSITIPDSVTTIGNEAFRTCQNVTSISIGNGVTSIDSYVFAWCTGLTSITIPNSVTSIKDNVFDQCKKLTSIVCNGITYNRNGNSINVKLANNTNCTFNIEGGAGVAK